MRYFITLITSLFIFSILFISCIGEGQVEQASIENDTYKLQSIKFSIKEGDGKIDTTKCSIDTTYFYNTNYSKPIKSEYFPYDEIKDSVWMEITSQEPTYSNDIKLILPPTRIPCDVEKGKILYIYGDSEYANQRYFISSMPHLNEASCDSKGTGSTGMLPPRTMEIRTGTYHRIHSQMSFQAVFVGVNMGETVIVNGKWHKSEVITHKIDNSSQISIQFKKLPK